MNATMEKFGWPETKLAETAHWAVMLRPEQPTAGALVVACKEPAKAFGEVSAAGFADLGAVVAKVEATLAAAIGYEKINWLMLMMVDPDVHFHVIPRYEGARALAGVEVSDAGWPGPPALGVSAKPNAAEIAAMLASLRADWPA